MAKHRYAFNEAKVQKYSAQGRGRGEGTSYRPWLEIHDVPSLGRVHRPYGNLTGRVHHLLSDGEWKCFLHFEADASYTDIREQFPMDRWETYRIATRMGIKHPITLDGTPYVMTTDFLLTRQKKGARVLVAKTFKYEAELAKPRVKELLAIEAEYWKQLDCHWECVTERLHDVHLIRNYDTVRAFFDIGGLEEPYENCFAELREAVLERVGNASAEPLLQACRALDREFSVQHGTAFLVARHLLARRVLELDLTNGLDIAARPVSAFRVRHPGWTH